MRPIVVAAALIAIIAGCATTADTPAQARVRAAFTDCAQNTNVHVWNVEPNGQFTWGLGTGPAGRAVLYNAPGDMAAMDSVKSCLRERYGFRFSDDPATPRGLPQQNAAASQVTPPLPSPSSGGVTVIAPVDNPSAPVWRSGDEWAFRYDNPNESGTYVWTVAREASIDGIPCYVIVTGNREIFYRTTDSAFVSESVDGSVIRRSTPPTVIEWPLTIGKSWEQTFVDSHPQDRTTANITRVVTVEARETVTVPAGTFDTFKVSVRNKRNGGLVYEGWYAPAVLQMIKLRESLRSGVGERELIGYKLTPR